MFCHVIEVNSMTTDSQARVALGPYIQFCRNAGVILAGLTCCAIPLCVAEVSAQPQAPLKTIVVTGKKPLVPDAEIKEQLEAAMRSDRFFPDQHVTVSIKDGVVTLRGIVFDEWDLRVAKRIAKRIPGVKRVINDLEISLGGE
jgi:hypothetical protein